jgi:hypothetical protein
MIVLVGIRSVHIRSLVLVKTGGHGPALMELSVTISLEPMIKAVIDICILASTVAIISSIKISFHRIIET